MTFYLGVALDMEEKLDILDTNDRYRQTDRTMAKLLGNFLYLGVALDSSRMDTVR